MKRQHAFHSFSIVILLTFVTAISAAETIANKKAPEFTQKSSHEWINSPPLSMKQLKGNVVLLDVWAYGCWNCYRSFPWLHKLEKTYASKKLKVIGIHTPEFEQEQNRENVIANVRRFELRHPIMMDNNFAYWKALENQYWPTFYLIDKKGNLRFRFIGETHAGDRNATTIDQAIKLLLKE
ncbi:MAG: Unknown protein [uncultured Thiotrichaceae bacterium]|uniref:Thioredoxin domain-containing protein n=1 Tax=uncultured Thiotrichaceae bacterium TaxID=298394 RepID=A0A6S6U823_9GAMM|nr:MAG: Unknown protein [uncultured Thiotrichaceae bacterium]